MKKILPLICVVLAILLCSAACLSPEINNENAASNNDVQNSASSSEPQNDSAIDNDDNENDSADDEETNTIDFSDKTYIAFGDSITYGADYTRGYAQMDNPYSELVASTLGMKSYNNAGVSGATLCSNSLGLACISDIVTNTSTSYDVISLLGGVNDFNRDLPLGSYGDNTNTTIFGSLDVIAKYLTTTFNDSFIFFMTPYREYWQGVHYLSRNSRGYNLEDVANAVKQVANKYTIPVLDLFNEGQFELEMYAAGSDGLHPSQEFITNHTAPQIARFIKDNYKKTKGEN